MTDISNVKEKFHHYFDITIANTPQLLKEVYRIRYEVYCEEMGFEPENSAHIEHDAYDAKAIHVLIRHRPTSQYIGTIRMVLHDGNRDAFVFPMEKHCPTMDRTIFDIENIGRDNMAEVSRVAVVRNFRRRKEDVIGLAGAIVSEDVHHAHAFSYIPMSLYFASYIISLWQHLDFIIAISEPKLMRHIHFTGMQAMPFGTLFEYKGKRAPYFFDLHNINVIEKFTPLYKVVQENLKESYQGYLNGAKS